MKTTLVYIRCSQIYFYRVIQILETLITLILELPDTHIPTFFHCRFLKVPERYILASNIFLFRPEQIQNPDCAPKQIFTIQINADFAGIYFNVLINISFLRPNPRQAQLACSKRVQRAPVVWGSTTPSVPPFVEQGISVVSIENNKQ